MLPWTVVWTESRSNIPNTVRHILVPCSCFFPLKTRNTKRLLLKLTQHLVAVPLRHAAFFVGGARLTLVRPQLSYGRSFSHGMGRRWCCQQSNCLAQLNSLWAKTDHVNITSTSKRTANPRLSTRSWLSCEFLLASKAWRSFAQGVAQTSYKRPCCNESGRNSFFFFALMSNMRFPHNGSAFIAIDRSCRFGVSQSVPVFCMIRFSGSSSWWVSSKIFQVRTILLYRFRGPTPDPGAILYFQYKIPCEHVFCQVETFAPWTLHHSLPASWDLESCYC